MSNSDIIANHIPNKKCKIICNFPKSKSYLQLQKIRNFPTFFIFLYLDITIMIGNKLIFYIPISFQNKTPLREYLLVNGKRRRYYSVILRFSAKHRWKNMSWLTQNVANNTPLFFISKQNVAEIICGVSFGARWSRNSGDTVIIVHPQRQTEFFALKSKRDNSNFKFWFWYWVLFCDMLSVM